MDRRNELLEIYNKLISYKGECSCLISDDCGAKNLTLTQLKYLQLIHEHEYITLTEIARITNNSKPTINQMVSKFIRDDFVYKQNCSKDKRVHYLHLTDQGEKIARAEELISVTLIDRLMNTLSEEDIDSLIVILRKL